jgi:hypothetical protein
MNFYWRRVESQEKLQRRGNSVHNITLVGFRGQKVAGSAGGELSDGGSAEKNKFFLKEKKSLRGVCFSKIL